MLKTNPPVRYPQIPISFGNSYVGIFDAEKAKQATHRLFAAYGITLQKDVPMKGAGYEFVADGYHPMLNVGFKIVIPEGPVGLNGKALPKQAEEFKLDDKRNGLPLSAKCRPAKSPSSSSTPRAIPTWTATCTHRRSITWRR